MVGIDNFSALGLGTQLTNSYKILVTQMSLCHKQTFLLWHLHKCYQLRPNSHQKSLQSIKFIEGQKIRANFNSEFCRLHGTKTCTRKIMNLIQISIAFKIFPFK